MTPPDGRFYIIISVAHKILQIQTIKIKKLPFQFPLRELLCYSAISLGLQQNNPFICTSILPITTYRHSYIETFLHKYILLNVKLYVCFNGNRIQRQ